MRKTTCCRLAAGILLALLASPFASAAPQEERGGDVVARLYQVHYLDVNQATLVVRQECLEKSRGDCDTRIRPNNFLELHADPKTHEIIAQLLEKEDVPPATQVFQVTLVVADKSGDSRPDLPPHAMRALTDLAEFLPFRNFRLLDSGYMRTSRGARLALGGDLGYRAVLEFRGDPTSGKPLFIERFELDQDSIRYIRPTASGDATRENFSRRVISSSFSMDVGETVVVGTSKLDGGDEALVVLLTAVKE